MKSVSPVELLLKQAVHSKIGSGIAASYGHLSDLQTRRTGEDLFVGTTSHLNQADLVTPHTFFDLASLTKILATTTLAMVKRQEGMLNLDETLEVLLPAEVALNRDLAPITVRSLLAHASGLPAWKSFYESLRTRFRNRLPWEKIIERKRVFDELLYQSKRESSVFEKFHYSDLGFLILERALAQDFETEVNAVWKKIPGLKFQYRPVVSDADSSRIEMEMNQESIAATELCPWRGLIQGQVHDDNAWSRGGVAGHAGVFGRLEDVKLWTHAIFSLAIVNETTLREFTTEIQGPTGPRRALGFDLPPQDGTGSTGFSFSKNSAGHLGFTGTSLWVDLDSGQYAILLTNRIHPDRNDPRIRVLRRDFHQLVQGELQK